MNERLRKQLKKSHYLRRGLEPDLADAAETRWLQKPVTASRDIPLAENWEKLRLVGPGLLDIAPGAGRRGNDCVLLDYPAEQPVQNPSGRAYSTSEIFVPIDHEDLSAYNRICVWIYIDSDNSAVNHMTLSLHNAGPKVMPVPGRFEGYHNPTVLAGVWTPLVWEMPRVDRNDVTAISLCAFANGTSYPGDQRIRLRLDGLRLETVDVDSDLGWALRDGAVAFCHSGYRLDAPKQALVGRGVANTFTLRDAQDKTVFTGQATPGQGGHDLLDFSAFATEGWYTLHVGNLATKPFPIGGKAYLAAAWKVLNFFFVERCGFTVPGNHTECHLDVMSVHPDGRKRCVAGGWHDAGDLTQDGRNSMECTLAMLDLWQATQQADPALAARSLEEARWGLDWLLRCRWGDGYRHCGRIITFWTRNILGDPDDIDTKAENRPYDNLLVASVEAEAARLFREDDPLYARLLARYAKEDLRFGLEWLHKAPAQSFSAATPLQLHAQAALSAATLYQAFGEEQHLAEAARLARVVMACQNQAAPASFKLPIAGYFYESPAQKRVQAYFHRSYEHVPLQALCRLLTVAPSHPDAPQWRRSLELYAGYIKSISDVTPYGLLATGIYEVDNTDFTNLYHEGDKTQGGPSLEEFNAQVRNGIPLDERHFLRVFPVAFQFRGFHAPIMGKAIAALEIADLLGDAALRAIATRQLEWMLGYNPFATSSVYGEGYDYHPLYTGLQPQIVGAVPVGFETYENLDEPYYPIQNLPTYKEIWVHTTGRLMQCLARLGFSERAANKKGGEAHG